MRQPASYVIAERLPFSLMCLLLAASATTLRVAHTDPQIMCLVIVKEAGILCD